MKKRIVVFGLALTQAATMFAQVEENEFSLSGQDSVQAVTDSAVVADPVVPAVVIPDSVISEDNDLYELDKHKPLPEYRWTTLGVTLGGGASWYSSSPANNSTAACIRAGMNFDIPFGQYFSLQPELLFATRGGGYQVVSAVRNSGKDVIYSLENNLEEHLFYFDVPINCKFSKRMNFNRQTTGRAFVSAGPVLSLGVYGKSVGVADKVSLFQNDSDNEHEVACYKNFDFSFNFRLGYDFDAGYSIMAGYQLGVCNLMNDGKFGEQENNDYGLRYYHKNFPEVRNNSLYMAFGYRW